MPKGQYDRGGYRPRKWDDPVLVAMVAVTYQNGATQQEIGRALGGTLRLTQGLFRRNKIPARVPAKRNQWGAANSSWVGDAANYQTSHARVYSRRGKASRCEMCGTTDPSKNYDWANLTGRYPDPSDYAEMCRSCHRKYDNSRRKEVMPCPPSRS